MSLMGNKGKQDQSTHININDYEKSRLMRVQENKERLRHLGVKTIANSLTSLVDCQNAKKKRVKPTNNNVRDVDYTPMGDDCDGDSEEIDTSVEVSKKFSLGLSARKENQSGGGVTMGQLILNKKGIQGQNEVFKQNEAKRTCITHRAKTQFALVDEDDDNACDDEISQDINEANCEQDGLKDDENEGDQFMRSKGVMFADDQDAVDEDDEFEDMTNIQNGIQEHDIDDDLEKEDDVFIQEQLEGRQLEKATETSKTKKRGPTMMHGVHVRNANEREVIICNEFGQPIGPVTEEKDIVGQFSRFLGTIARNYNYAPLTYASWHKMPKKDRMWEYVLEKYIVPDAAKTWVLKSIGSCWSVYKCRIKKKHFYEHKDNKTIWKNRPKSIPENDFSRLLSLWNKKDVMERCWRAKERRMSQKNNHTAGPKSFARVREEMKNDDPNKEPPSLTQMFERTRKRTEGRVYVDTYDDTANKIEQMKNYKSLEDGSDSVDPFLGVMNKEYNGYRRLYGRGVTNKVIKIMDGGDTSLKSTSHEIEKKELLDLRKEIEEDHERKKAELKAMKEDIENQRDKLVDEAMKKLMEKLPPQILPFLT